MRLGYRHVEARRRLEGFIGGKFQNEALGRIGDAWMTSARSLGHSADPLIFSNAMLQMHHDITLFDMVKIDLQLRAALDRLGFALTPGALSFAPAENIVVAHQRELELRRHHSPGESRRHELGHLPPQNMIAPELANPDILARVRETDPTLIPLSFPFQYLPEEPLSMLIQELQTPLGRERCVNLRRLHPQGSPLQNADTLSQEILQIDHVAITHQQNTPAALKKIGNQKLPFLNERAPTARLGAK